MATSESSRRAKPRSTSSAGTKKVKRKADTVDLSDIPEQRDWSGAERGRFYRPVKQPVTLRIDADVLAWFKAQGEGYQTRMNQVLRQFVSTSTARRR